jgi:Cu2+-exporting ATPase
MSLGLEQSHALAEQMPAMKQSFVAKRQSEGAIVAMIGDGHNDAPVLAQADVSIAMQGAAPLAQQKADIYCLRLGLGGVALAMDTARKSRIILRQNLGWAVLYNLVAIPFAAAGLITPVVASIGMAASSLLVVLNSSRLLR